MKIVKPMTLGVLHKPYRHGGQDRLCVATLAFFRLGEEGGRRFLVENLQWPAVLASLPAEQPLDEIMPKACGEVLLSGAAHAPDGRPRTEMGVRLTCAGIDKALHVVGDRQWLYGLFPWYRVTRPQPFTAMPLGYERAFGGPRHPGNPIGCGYTGNRFGGLIGLNHGAMPNIERPGDAPARHWRRQPPAGFGPIDLRWTPRQGRGGTYDAAWLREDFPGLARDIDWRMFNRAPEDQWLAGFFAGGEAYRLEGMHPARSIVAGHLPTQRPRAFALRKDADAAGIEEIPLRWDTVWFFPEHLLGVAVCHGEMSIADSDAQDVGALMVAYEDAQHARTLAHYADVLRLRTDPATAAIHALNDSPLTPARSAAEEAQLAAARAAEIARRDAERAALLGAMHEEVALGLAEAGLEAPAPPRPDDTRRLSVPTDAEIASGDADLSGCFEQARAIAEEVRRQGEEKLKELAAQQAELAALTGPAPVPDDEAAWQAALAKASQPAWDLTGGRPEDDERWREMAEAFALSPPASPEEAAQRAEALAALARTRAEERRGRRAAPKPVPKTLAAPVAARLGRQALAWHAAGVCLAGRDLAGADLRGARLAGADLRETLLEHADLTGADLSGANLAGAVLTAATLDAINAAGADCEGANLCLSQGRGACFARANLAGVQISKAVWPGAKLDGARLDRLLGIGCDLTGASLDGCRGRSLMLPGARLADSRWRGAACSMLAVVEADCSGADFSSARLDATVFLDTTLAASRWTGAELTNVFAGGKTVWRDADVGGAKLHKCGFHGADFEGARLAGTIARQCDFGACSLAGADLEGALLAESLFYGAKLADCRAPSSDWFRALCRKSDFSRADLRDANFVHAELADACFAQAQLRGVRLDNSRRVA